MLHTSPSSIGSCVLSVVLPCLNEADTVGFCIDDVSDFLTREGITGEVIVADNGSTDASVAIAMERGVRVVSAEERGYGHALRAGLAAARGSFIVMMDSDCSYHAADIARFMTAFREGADCVQGCRFASGGGTILPGAMPPLHKIGNPLFTFLLRAKFHLPLHDVHCGMRGITHALLRQLSLQSGGMECAFELLLQAKDQGAHFAEVPITLYPDRRKTHGPHLHTFRDGWRMLRYVQHYKTRG